MADIGEEAQFHFVHVVLLARHHFLLFVSEFLILYVQDIAQYQVQNDKKQNDVQYISIYGRIEWRCYVNGNLYCFAGLSIVGVAGFGHEYIVSRIQICISDELVVAGYFVPLRVETLHFVRDAVLLRVQIVQNSQAQCQVMLPVV